MKVEVFTSSEKFSDAHDYRKFLEIRIDGKKAFRFLDGEPEDANLSRDFNAVFGIADAMKSAYEAGKRGDEFVLTETDCDDWV